MKTCAFFGHRRCPGNILPEAKRIVEDLINDYGVDNFLVGHQGDFDNLMLMLLREEQAIHSQIKYRIVLAYMPKEGIENCRWNYEETLYPEGMELVHPRYAISHRNRWMVKNSDFVLVYVNHGYGGAAEAMKYAARQGKTVINIAESTFKLS